jgi:rod shape-determining protein MreC
MKPLFARGGSSQTARLFTCVAISLVLLAMEQRGALTAIRAPLAAMSYPVQKLVSAPSKFFRDALAGASSPSALSEENRRLREEALLLKGRQLRFEALEQENIRLRGLLDASYKVGDQVLIAEPLSIGQDPFEHLVAVNKGSRFGVFEGQAVLDANGIVGQVLRVTPYSADVVMITDPSHAIPVQINRSGLRTLAVGTGHTDRLDLPYLPGNADVKEGDLLVTSGLGGVFPAGYPVAKVAPIAAGGPHPGSGKISAVPLAALDRNRELLLVWSNNQPIPRIPHSSGDAAPTHARQ